MAKSTKRPVKSKIIKIVNNTTNGDANEQAQIIRNFIDDPEVNVILVNPNDNTALTAVIAEAQAAGKLVVVFDATAEAPGTLQVTLDLYAWNKKNVDFIADALQSGNAIQISGLDGHPANNARLEATEDVLANYPDINLLQTTSGGLGSDESKGSNGADTGRRPGSGRSDHPGRHGIRLPERFPGCGQAAQSDVW